MRKTILTAVQVVLVGTALLLITAGPLLLMPDVKIHIANRDR